MASFEDLFAGYGMSPGLGGGYGGDPYGGGGFGQGIGGMRNSLVGMGLGLMSGPSTVALPLAMKGYEQGAAIDARSADRRAALYQQQRERELQRQMQRERMGQQESQFTRSLAAQGNKPVISYFTKGYDDNNQPIQGARIFTPITGTVREIPIETAQRLEGAGMGTAEGAPIGDQGATTPQQFTDAPVSENVEDRRQATPTAPAPAQMSTADLIKRFRAKGIPMGPAMDAALKAYAGHAAGASADVASGKLTEQQAKTQNYATRMEISQADLSKGIDEIGSSFWGKLSERLPDELRGYAQDPKYQKYDTAKNIYLDALLRQDSGAQINKDEYARYERALFPQPGDTPQRIEQKRRVRDATTAVMKRMGGQGYVSPELAIAEARKATEAEGETKPTPRKPSIPAPGAAPGAAGGGYKTAPDDVMAKARQAIQSGADPNKVRQRLLENGYNPSGL